ncbi:MAG: DUF421 domain-containing protein [Anaerolineae bacterium]
MTAIASAADTILRTSVIYFALLIGLRLSGKREIGQITLFDLVMLLLVANSVQNAMVGADNTLVGGLISAATLLAVHSVVARSTLRWPRLRHLVEGTPTVLVSHGQVVAAHLRREGIDEEMLAGALREHGVADLKDVEMAVLEVDGSISVVTGGTSVKRIKKPLKFLTHR